MRVQLILNSDSQIRLPKSYNHILQGFIYSLFEPIFRRFLHNEAFQFQKRKFKLFCFSRIFGEFRNRKDCFEFKPPINIFISSSKRELLEKLAEGILTKDELILGKNVVFIEEMRVCSSYDFREEVIVKMLSPLTIYSTLKKSDGKKKTYYYSPFEKEFNTLIIQNLRKKYKLVYQKERDDFLFQIEPWRVKPRDEKVILFKDTVIKGWMGIYKLKSHPEILKLAYDTGLGSKNSQGFGMWEVVDCKI